MEALRRVFGAVDARFETTVTWRGAALDRLLDEGHAELTGSHAARLAARGWEVRPEVTFSEFGERGSIDLLATRADERAVLVIEIKTELVSVEETLRRLDVKARLAPRIVAGRLGWRPLHVGRLLVILETSTARRRVDRHAAVLDTALPARSRAVRQWLEVPSGALAGPYFSSPTHPGSTQHSPRSKRRLSEVDPSPSSDQAGR